MPMKNTVKLIVLMMVMLRCNPKPTTEEKSDKKDISNMLVQQQLTINKEKIYLLSLASKVPFDTVRLIIKDYYLNEYTVMFNNPLSLTDSTIISYKESIQAISLKYHLSESKIASLLFSFKYEMRSPEEIIEEYQDQLIDSRDYEDQ